MANTKSFESFDLGLKSEIFKTLCINQVPIGETFRYNKKWYDRISTGLAQSNEENDNEFLEIDYFNGYEICAVEKHIEPWD